MSECFGIMSIPPSASIVSWVIHGPSVREPIDIQLPTLPKIVTRDEEIAHKYWYSHLKKIREIAKQNLIGAKRIEKKKLRQICKTC